MRRIGAKHPSFRTSWRCMLREPRPTVQLLESAPISVRIPRFQTEGLVDKHVAYTLVVESPCRAHTVLRRYSEFQELHKHLSRQSFGYSLAQLPSYRILANFDARFLERRRQSLEAYLAFLSLHVPVLLHGELWAWLEVTQLDQVMARLVAAQMAQLKPEIAESLRRLDAILDGTDGVVSLHPAALECLRDIFGAAEEDLQGDAAEEREELVLCACHVLQHAMSDARAQELFLSPGYGGARSLVAACRSRRAADAVVAVLEALPRKNETGAARTVGSRAEELELGECCICLDRGKSHAFLPCGHLCVCMDCASFVTAMRGSCPICRRDVQVGVHIFV